MRRSGCGRPSAARIGRLSQGPVSTAGGQVPSFSPPSTRRSARCRRASSGPQMASRGWRPKLGRTISGSSMVASSAGHSPPAMAALPAQAARRRASASASASPASPDHSASAEATVSAAAMVASSRASGAAPGLHRGRQRRRRSLHPVDQLVHGQPVRQVAEARLVDPGADRRQAGHGLQPAQAFAIEPARGVEHGGAVAAQRAQRMLQQGEQGDRREALVDSTRPAPAAGRRTACRRAACPRNRRCRYSSACSSAATRRARSRSGVTRAAVCVDLRACRRATCAAPARSPMPPDAASRSRRASHARARRRAGGPIPRWSRPAASAR